MGWRAIERFLKYSLIGFGTFLLDLALLTILTDFANFNYVIAAGVSFLLAVSLNYVLSRRLVFWTTKRDHKTGYSYFLIIAGVGLVIVMGGMSVLVGVFGVPKLMSRIIISIFTGIWNYLMNLFFNFKVAGDYGELV